MNPINRLHQLRDAHVAAGSPDSLITLISSAAATGNEAVAAAVVAHVEATAPKEAEGLAAVARVLDTDQRAPTLWMSVDVLAPDRSFMPGSSEARTWMASTQDALRTAWCFRREADVNADGKPIEARILFPAKRRDPYIVEAAATLLRADRNYLIGSADDARAALLAAAVANDPAAAAAAPPTAAKKR